VVAFVLNYAGTGKTMTVVEAALQALRYTAGACVLLCAPSDAAAGECM
jgi:hypothetical protein